MKTERLHYDDPLLLAFEARVLERATHAGRPSVILDRTAFYPESGGQMADTGTLDGCRVIDVQLDEAGRVHHVVEGPLPEPGAVVRGAIDEARRREHMALHTGQHALSHALLSELSAVTISSRLGESACTVDVDRSGLTLADVRRAEAIVNALIDEDRPVRQFFPSDDELARLELRKPPPETDRVRVVEIEGFDVTPCGGTHCTRTSQIELVWVRSVERYKGGTRVTFSAGPRARRLLMEQAEALRTLAGELACAPLEVGASVGALRRKLDEAREEAGALRAALADAWAARLDRPGTIVERLDRADATLLKMIAERLAHGDRVVALGADAGDGVDVVVARGPEARASAGELVRAMAKAAGGRGGGRPELAQGRLPAGSDLAALFAAALAASRG
ncbi:MAG TPA: DHHA1 domain-containing protein [Sandaracinaceae bacterium]